jgi:nucleotide-binding universal stress UspA family protein
LSAVPFGGDAVMSGPDLDPAIEQEAQRAAEEGRPCSKRRALRQRCGSSAAFPSGSKIVEVCDELDAAVVVLGSHGHSGLQAVLLGSAATAVSQYTSLPVLIVH